MTKQKRELLEKARRRYGYITPCAGKQLCECFQDHGKYGLFLYFNTLDGSTHTVSTVEIKRD